MKPLGYACIHAIREGGSTGRVGSFGLTRDGGRKQHNGTDFLAPMGAPVFAAFEGEIRRAGFQRNRFGKPENEGYGLRVYLWAGDTDAVYAHLSGIQVGQGDFVYAGQLIGWIGRTGNVEHDCPTHLHFGIRRAEEWIDPEAYFVEG